VAQDSARSSRTRRRFGRIRKLPSGRWQAGYTGPDGTVHGADQTFPTKASAERWLSLAEADIVRGEWAAPERRAETVGEWADRWLAGAHHLKPSSIRAYRASWAAHTRARWDNEPLSAVTLSSVQRWVDEMVDDGHGPDVIRRAVETLRGALGQALREGVLAANPCVGVRLPRRNRHTLTILTPAQVADLAREVAHPVFAEHAGNGARIAVPPERPEYGLAVRLAAYTGLRAGELWALRRGRLVLDGDVPAIVVAESITDVAGHLVAGPTKTGQNRRVPLPRTLVEPLRHHLDSRPAESDALVFAAPGGGPMRHSWFYRQHFRPAAVRIDCPGLRFHDLRHSYAALLISQGAHPRAIMERLGHSSIAVTLGTYGHLLPGLDAALTERVDAAIVASEQQPASCTEVARAFPPEPDP